MGLEGNGLESYWGLGTWDLDGLEVGSLGRAFASEGMTLEVPLNMEGVGFWRRRGRAGVLALVEDPRPWRSWEGPAAKEPARLQVGVSLGFAGHRMGGCSSGCCGRGILRRGGSHPGGGDGVLMRGGG